MRKEFCPNCQLRTIVQKHCLKCAGYFGTGYIVNRKRMPETRLALPTALEGYRLPHMILRDSGRIRTINFGKGLFPERK